MIAARGARPSTSGAQARIATPEVAAVRSAVIGPASRIAVGTPVTGSLSSSVALMAGMPRSLLWLTASTHFMPTRSAIPDASPPGR